MFATRNRKRNFQPVWYEFTIDTHPEDGLHEAARIRTGAKSSTQDKALLKLIDIP